MNVALGSIFRNSAAYLPRYFDQVAALRDPLFKAGHSLRLILVEGDSTDGTGIELTRRSVSFPTTFEIRNHGGPVFGSVDDAQRWRQISFVCDGVLEQVGEQDDALIYVESDLIWNAETMLALLEHLKEVDAVAPMCFWKQVEPIRWFYDTWGFRKDGARFKPDPPYHPALDGQMTEIDSAGSCIVMRGAVARQCRFVPSELGIVGFCADLRAKGFKLHLDPAYAVYHP